MSAAQPKHASKKSKKEKADVVIGSLSGCSDISEDDLELIQNVDFMRTVEESSSTKGSINQVQDQGDQLLFEKKFKKQKSQI